MRPASWQRAVTGLVGVASAIVAMGCNAILGNDEGTLRPATSTATSTSSATVTTTSAGGAGGGTGSATGGTAGASGSGTGGTVGTGGSRDGGVDASETDGNVMPPGDAMPTPDGGGCNPTLPPSCAGRAQKTVLTCDADSRTFVSTSCPGAKLCDASSGPNQGTCQDPVPACAGKMPGDKFCMGKDSVTCGPDLVTSTTDTCPFTCIGAGQCAACTPGAKQCMGNGYQTCQANGTWSASTACPSACIGAGECGSCTPNEKGCSGNGWQTCQANGSWGTATACPYVCTGAGVCTGECAPGVKKCSSSGNGAQTCGSDGLYGMANACPYLCTGGMCSGDCVPGSKRCTTSGSGFQTCGTDGLWGAVEACPYVCGGQGVCGGVCTPGTTQCMGNGVQTCQSNGYWAAAMPCMFTCLMGQGKCGGTCVPGTRECSGNGFRTCQSGGIPGTVVTPCASTAPVCAGGGCVQPPSCTMPALTGCGSPSPETCCASSLVTGGMYNRANDPVDGPATVSDFRMDNYEVTVGRFRKFVAAYPGNKPTQGAGRNPNNGSDIGWDAGWNGLLPTDAASLRNHLNTGDHTWTDTGTPNENRPINQMTWYLAQAFCIWDGGRLATEAEWNYAAAGGNQQRLYPWGNAPITVAHASFYGPNQLDEYGCWGDGAQGCTATTDLIVVGSKLMGKGLWGQFDLAGNVAEWTSDYFYSLQTPCNNCSNPMGSLGRHYRGGSFNSSNCDTTYRATYDAPHGFGSSYGIRCVRLP